MTPVEAVGAAVYMGDSEEAFHWIGEINRRQEEKKVPIYIIYLI